MHFMRRNEGAISIFLIIILLPVMLLSSILIDGSRKLAADMIVQEAADSAAMSTLADYNGRLKTEFGLFALNDPDNADEAFKKYLASTLMASGINDPAYTEVAYNYLKGMLFGGSKFQNADFINFYDFRIEQTNVEPIYSLANPEILENQIVEYMKYRAPVEMAKKSDFLKIAEGVKQINEVKEASDLLSKKNKYDRELVKLQALCKDAQALVSQVNQQFGNSYFQQVEAGYMAKISAYIAALKVEDEALKAYNETPSDPPEPKETAKKYWQSCQDASEGALQALDEYRKAVSDNIQKKGIDICQDSFMTDDIIDKAKAILKKIDEVTAQANKLIKEMEGKKNEPGMVGEVAKQIIDECQTTLQELNKDSINNLIADSETKKNYLESFKNSFNTCFDHTGFTKDSDLNFIKKTYTNIVTNHNLKAGYQIVFKNPFQFGAASGVTKEAATSYRKDNKPEVGKGIANIPSNVNLETGPNKYANYESLPSRLSNPEGKKLQQLSQQDKEYVGKLLEDLQNSMDTPPNNSEDLKQVLDSIDFVEEEKPWWKRLLGFLDSDKTAFDVVLGGVSWVFEGVKRFFEDLRDDIMVVEYASGTFKSRLTVDNLQKPADMTKEYVVKWRYETDENGQVGEQDLRGRRKLDRPTKFQKAELEYIVAGNSSEEWNKNQVYASIFSLRLMNNLIAVYTDKKTNQACLGAAAVVSAWAGGIGTPVLHWAFMLALASAETTLDMNFLVGKGYKVPLIKRGGSTGNFRLSLDIDKSQSLPSEPKFADAGDIPVCYEDFLKILMIMLVDRNTRVKRIGDLIEMNMQAMGKTDFQMQKAYTFVRAESNATIDFMFLPVGVFKKSLNKPLNRMDNHKIIYQGY